MIAVRNLLRHPARSALTLLGVSLGVAVYVMLASLSEGMLGEIDGFLRRIRVDVVVQAERAATPLASRIPSAIAAEVAALPGVAEALVAVLGPVQVEEAPYVLLVGVPDLTFLASGLGLSRPELDAFGKGSALVGDRLSRKLGRGRGDPIEISGGRRLQVAAVYRTGNSVFDQALVVPIGDAREILRQEHDVNLVLLRAEDGYHPYGLLAQIRAGGGDVAAATSGDFMGTHALARTARAFTGAVSLLALVLSCAVVTTVLVVSVPERKGELGILMAVGWSRLRIVGTLLGEAVILCLLGGVAGNVAGWLGLRLLAGSRLTGLDWARAAVPPEIALASLGFCLAMGSFGVVYPAVLVWRLSPSEALESA